VFLSRPVLDLSPGKKFRDGLHRLGNPGQVEIPAGGNAQRPFVSPAAVAPADVDEGGKPPGFSRFRDPGKARTGGHGRPSGYFQKPSSANSGGFGHEAS